MKVHLKFNHEKESIFEAIDLEHTVEGFAEQLSDIFDKLMKDDSLDKKSRIAELLHDNLDYELILFLATEEYLKHVKTLTILKLLKGE
jgi:hypothetical protein